MKTVNNKNLDSFAAHFAKHFTQKSSPQEYRKIMSFGILYTVSPICSMKNWGKYSCTLCMKERIEKLTNRDIGTAEVLTRAQKCTEHAVTFQDSIGLPSTDDLLIGEKVTNFEFSKSTRKKNCFQLVEQIWKMRRSQPLRGYF